MSGNQVDTLLAEAERKWDEIGACGSCGWHDLFHNHESDIRWQLEMGYETIELLCHSENEDAIDHRGVKFRVTDLASNNPEATTAPVKSAPNTAPTMNRKGES